MYRRAGFAPSAMADREGFLELIAGRIYMDAARPRQCSSPTSPSPTRWTISIAAGRFTDASDTAAMVVDSRLKAGRRLAAAHATLRVLTRILTGGFARRSFPRLPATPPMKSKRTCGLFRPSPH